MNRGYFVRFFSKNVPLAL